ncbi:MAG: alpha/beta fold hydrolase [Myxococcales bacterium]|nr:MAG: alpha/beta fold hydrolase [Myxococcales bacterium]
MPYDLTDHLPEPREFDGYEILSRIGAGGMGHVYRARELALDREVAIKFVAAAEPGEHQRRRLHVEARAIARLQHPNVVGVYRIGEVAGRPYIAYELVSGRSLDREQLPLPWSRALDIGLRISLGLAAAHRRDVLHRDIKPANVMLTEAGEVKLLDFGLAKLINGGEPALSRRLEDGQVRLGAAVPSSLTATGHAMGTPLYMAPEIWLGEPATVQSDLYSLGILLYELLSGHLPFSELRHRDELSRAVLSGRPPPLAGLCPKAPQALTAVVERCLCRYPLERYASADELVVALDALSRLYQPFAAPEPKPHQTDDAELVASSFSRMSSQAERFATRVYERLFTRQPELRALFPVALGEQRKKLLGALQIMIENSKRPESLAPLLRDLGRRHAAYGVEAAHFDAIGEALLSTLADLEGARFSADLERAWSRTYQAIAEVMQSGLEEERPTATITTPDFAAAAFEREMHLDPPPIRYARSGEASIAYQISGVGPGNMMLVLGFVTHLELNWQAPRCAELLRGLSARSRLILFDKRGTGLSDPLPGLLSMDERLLEMLAVLDAAEAKQTVLFGVGDGAALSAAFAAKYPERVSGLVLYGGTPCSAQGPDWPHGSTPEAFARLRNVVMTRWGEPLFLERAPSIVDDEPFHRWWASYLRQGCGPGAATDLLLMNEQIDVRPVLRSITAPTLVLRREHDRWVPAAGSEHFAANIRGASLVLLPGADHLPFAGDIQGLLRETRRFLDELGERERWPVQAASR